MKAPRQLARCCLLAALALCLLAAPAGAASSAIAVDLTTGEVVYERAADHPRIPASVQKLYTTSTALRRFGSGARLSTGVVLDGEIDEQGRLDGDLALVGGGDPTLDQAGVGRLARQLRDAGLRRVGGSVLGDESWLDARRGGPRTGWLYDRDMGGVLGALTVARGWSARPGGPALAAARRLARSLRGRGISVAGRTKLGRAPSGVAPLAAVRSPTLARLARAVNVPSDNFAAEVLLKDLGAAFGRSGSTEQGAAVVRRTVSALGVDPGRIADGSGLSRANRVSARQVVELISAMLRSSQRREFISSLAVAGRSGTLRRRMRGTSAAGNCRAKTGTLRSVSTLAGLCRARDGHTIAFALMMHGVSVWRAHAEQDRAVIALTRRRAGVPGTRLPSP